jgi:hypothetical protein
VVISNGLCAAHGGGKRCQVDGCTKIAQPGANGREKCIAHGGGQECQHENCTTRAQRFGLCSKHGGVKLCIHPSGCSKHAVGRWEVCSKHGGPRRCKTKGCRKYVVLETKRCSLHAHEAEEGENESRQTLLPAAKGQQKQKMVKKTASKKVKAKQVITTKRKLKPAKLKKRVIEEGVAGGSSTTIPSAKERATKRRKA